MLRSTSLKSGHSVPSGRRSASGRSGPRVHPVFWMSATTATRTSRRQGESDKSAHPKKGMRTIAPQPIAGRPGPSPPPHRHRKPRPTPAHVSRPIFCTIRAPVRRARPHTTRSPPRGRGAFRQCRAAGCFVRCRTAACSHLACLPFACVAHVCDTRQTQTTICTRHIVQAQTVVQLARELSCRITCNFRLNNSTSGCAPDLTRVPLISEKPCLISCRDEIRTGSEVGLK